VFSSPHAVTNTTLSKPPGGLYSLPAALETFRL